MKKCPVFLGNNIGDFAKIVIKIKKGKAITKRKPAARSGLTVSTAIFIPIHVVPHVKHTMMNNKKITN